MYGGIHFVYNSLCGICAGIMNDIPIDKITKGISEFELTKGRMEIIERTDGVKIINDAYNAGYDSMKAAIEYLKTREAKKKIAILGDILELGEFAKGIHEKVGEEVCKNNIDVLITVGEQAKYIARKAEELGMDKNNIFIYDTNEEAIEKAKSIIEKDDCILVKASNGMKFKQIIEELK